MLETTLLTFLAYECSIFPMSISTHTHTHIHTHVCVHVCVGMCIERFHTYKKLSKTKHIITSGGIEITDILFLVYFCIL